MHGINVPTVVRNATTMRRAEPEIPPFVSDFIRSTEITVTIVQDRIIEMDYGDEGFYTTIRKFLFSLMVESILDSTTGDVDADDTDDDEEPARQVLIFQSGRLRKKCMLFHSHVLRWLQRQPCATGPGLNFYTSTRPQAGPGLG